MWTVRLRVWSRDAGYGCSKRDCMELLPQEIKVRWGPKVEGQMGDRGATGPVLPSLGQGNLKS